MRSALVRIIAILFVLFLNYSSAIAQEDFFSRKSEGWFWYEVAPEEPEKKEPEEKDELTSPPPPKPPEQKEPEAGEEAGPAPLSSAWIKANLTKYLERATDNPTQENVAAYLYLQRLSVDKAQRFADATQTVIQQEPLLDETLRRPTATFGAAQKSARANAQMNEALSDLAEQVGIWVFFRSDCANSLKIKSPLESLQRQYGFNIYPISMDGNPLEGFFDTYVVDQGQSKSLQVIETPAVYLANPKDNAISPVSQGLVAVPELKRRILIAAVTSGWIDKEQFEETRPAGGYVMDGEELQGISQEDIDDPQELIKVLRRQLLKQQH